MDTKESVGNRIAKLRLAKKWTQNALASKMYVSDKAISKWEGGHGEPSIDNIRALSDLFGVSTDYLLNGINPPDWITAEEKPKPKAIQDSLTLKKVDITGDVLGKFGLFSIKQSYINNTKTAQEVFYTFPIAKSSSIYDFEAKVGQKVIKAIVKEKKEAKKDYQKAIAAGDSAYMLERTEGNVFKMTVGRIMPNEQVDITLRYIDALEILNNIIELRIPTVVAPRYNDAITAKQTYESELDYSADIKINIDKKLKIADITSPSHSIKIEKNIISTNDVKLNKDYILQIKLDGQALSSGYYKKSEQGEVYAFLQFMPDLPEPKQATPKKYVFVVDCSGSMTGTKMQKTKTALKKCLGQLKEHDEFAFIAFGSNSSIALLNAKGKNEATTVLANPDNIKRGLEYVESLSANMGGTEIWTPIEIALNNFGKDKTVVLLTDGQVGRADDVAQKIQENIKDSKLFIFGIDSAVYDAGLTAFAKAGNGSAEFFTPDEKLDDKIIRQFARISGTSCAEISLEAGSNVVLDKLMPDTVLFNHEYWCAVLKLKDLKDDFNLVCSVDGKQYDVKLSLSSVIECNIELDKLYAKEKITYLNSYIRNNKYGGDNTGYEDQIIDIAVKYNIDSDYTAFIAVNKRDEKGYEIPVQQQIELELPAGWSDAVELHEECDYMMLSESVVPMLANATSRAMESRRVSHKKQPGFVTKKASSRHESSSALKERLAEFIANETVKVGSVVMLEFADGTQKLVIIKPTGSMLDNNIETSLEVWEDSELAKALIGKTVGTKFSYKENGKKFKGKIIEIHNLFA